MRSEALVPVRVKVSQVAFYWRLCECEACDMVILKIMDGIIVAYVLTLCNP
jgi:hypothetical protein